MKKLYAAIVFLIFIVPIKTHAQATGVGSRMNEVFMRTDLAAGPTLIRSLGNNLWPRWLSMDHRSKAL